MAYFVPTSCIKLEKGGNSPYGEMGPFDMGTSTGSAVQCGAILICLRAIGSWYRDNSWFVYLAYPWFARGGDFSYGTGSGIFYYSSYYGNADNNISFALF